MSYSLLSLDLCDGIKMFSRKTKKCVCIWLYDNELYKLYVFSHNEIQTVNVKVMVVDFVVLYNDHDTWFVLNEHKHK